ncbi:polyprenyl synthetase family protein [Robiginitomaculum antarcticum]|uniref:polyprenyl synthetase family protein n=1 Tax=Robiginitomaculum antarcticum TaxID=437507 RepID=UPI000369DA09|nr:polyprenyl synthetase family protein [Robiginitomaculum antarcticum]
MTATANQTAQPEYMITDIRARVNTRLTDLSIGSDFAPRLNAAIAHSLLAPGKRFRPLLCILLTAEFDGDIDAAMDAGCAAEMVHTASLILDDLPCMDDADLRRGIATTHLQFDESTAILAAVALLNRAYGVIARTDQISAQSRVKLTELLSRAVGSHGLIAGQVADLENINTAADAAHVEQVNALKTGALFDYSILAAANICDLDEDQTNHCQEFSSQIGLAFQLLDDLKDQLMTEVQAGKTIDRDIGKATLLALDGHVGAKTRLRGYLRSADEALTALGVAQNSLIRATIAAQFKMPDTG